MVADKQELLPEICTWLEKSFFLFFFVECNVLTLPQIHKTPFFDNVTVSRYNHTADHLLISSLSYHNAPRHCCLRSRPHGHT